MTLFHEHKNGKLSFRRTIGAIIIFVGIVFLCIDTFTDYIVNETIWLSMFGGGVSIILSTMVKNRNSFEKPNKPTEEGPPAGSEDN